MVECDPYRRFVHLLLIKLAMDALACCAEEGRKRQRYSSGRSLYPVIRRFPNGEIHPDVSRDNVS